MLIVSDNLEPYWLHGVLSHAFVAPITVFGLYLGAELMAPHQKKLILVISVSLALLFDFIYSL
ncbi:MAG: hypothetical protein ACTSU4_04970 [Promethearchaeota archaeon]